jgi:FixJ family two-component response regulator
LFTPLEVCKGLKLRLLLSYHFLLPLCPVAPQCPPAASESITVPQSTMVFIIDDDPSVRIALGRLLHSAGHACETYPSAQAFLARTPHAGPCCVVLDVRMPGLDGLGLQETLAAAGRDEPIIFITGYADVPTCAKAMKAGAVNFLS